MAKKQETDLVLEINDNGCGVDPSALPKLTDAFFQGNAELSRAHEGAGLGLHIVSKFAALHNGVVEFESEPGNGFTARLRFSDILLERRSRAA